MEGKGIKGGKGGPARMLPGMAKSMKIKWINYFRV